MDPTLSNKPPVAALRGNRSFVLRQSRMSPAQQRAVDALMPRYGLALGTEPLDFKQVFGRDAPLILEIGFGMGDATAAIAQALPEQNFLGVEVHLPGVGALLKRVEAEHISNLRVIRADALLVLQHMIAPKSLAGVHLFFPDPWPKKRHHKRRIVQASFLDLVASRLKPGGYLHFATDWQDYAEHALATLSVHPRFRNTAEHYAPRPAYRPITKFEQRGLKLGHGVWDLVFTRLP